MATGMREKTTNVGGVIKRIWYAMTGATQEAELASLDDTGKFKCVSEQISGLAGAGSRMVVADSAGNLSASGVITKLICHYSFNFTAFYGINYINSGTGGQSITMPLALLGVEVEIISKTQGVNTFLKMSGTNKIYDINGNDVTSTYTAPSGLSAIKRMRFIGTYQADRNGSILNSGAVDWVVVERVNA